MSITDRIYNILISSATMGINFWFKGVNGNMVFILAPDFILAANCLKANKITVVEGVAPAGKAIYTAWNDGFRNANTMYIGPNNFSKNFEALVVHETVHAIHDLKSQILPFMDSEVAAYIAQGFYAKNIGVPNENFSPKDHVYYGKMIADDFVAGLEIESWLQELRDRLQNDPDYKPFINQNFIGDG